MGTEASWEWYSGNCGGTGTHVGTGSPISVSPTDTTTYYVRAEGDCNITSCASICVEVIVHVEKIDFISYLNIYPNPNRGVFVIKIEITKPKDLHLKLFTSTGQLVYQEKHTKLFGVYQKTINLNTHRNGIYYLNVITEDGMISKKVILQ